MRDARLVIDPGLAAAWTAVGPPTTLRGLAAAVTGGRAAAIAVTDRPLTESESAVLADALAASLGVAMVELIDLHTLDLRDLLRQWVNQAAQGSGRGVSVELMDTPPQAPLRVLVRAVDSSARELTLRLASPHEPSLPALRALLGGRAIDVVDAETV